MPPGEELRRGLNQHQVDLRGIHLGVAHVEHVLDEVADLGHQLHTGGPAADDDEAQERGRRSADCSWRRELDSSR